MELPFLKSIFGRGMVERRDPVSLGTSSRAVELLLFGTSWLAFQVLIGGVRAISDPSDEKIQKTESNSCSSFVYGETKAATLISE